MEFRTWLESGEDVHMMRIQDIFSMDDKGNFAVWKDDEHIHDMGPAAEFMKKNSSEFARMPNIKLMQMLQRRTTDRHGTVGDMFQFVCERNKKIVGVFLLSRVSDWQIKKNRGMAIITFIAAEDKEAAEAMLKHIITPLDAGGGNYLIQGSHITVYVDLDNKPVLDAIKSMGIFHTKIEGDRVMAEYPDQMQDRPAGANTGFNQRVGNPIGYYFDDEEAKDEEE